MTIPNRIVPGQIWLEVRTGRHIRILEEEVHGTGPSWTYCKSDGTAEPHGPDHPEWFWHYCDVYDFAVFNRFTFVSGDRG